MSILKRNFAFRYIIWVFILKRLFNDTFAFSIFFKRVNINLPFQYFYVFKLIADLRNHVPRS